VHLPPAGIVGNEMRPGYPVAIRPANLIAHLHPAHEMRTTEE
jgi:hypothetical protein